MANNNSEYKNVIVAGVWATKNGHFSTMPLDEKALKTLADNAETGGKFLIRKRSEASIAKAQNPETTPQYYLEFVPAEEVKKFTANRSRNDVI